MSHADRIEDAFKADTDARVETVVKLHARPIVGGRLWNRAQDNVYDGVWNRAMTDVRTRVYTNPLFIRFRGSVLQ